MQAQYNRKVAFKIIDDLKPRGRTWEEIKDRLNTVFFLDLDESAYRKPYTAYRMGREDALPDKEFELLAEEKRRIALEKRYLSYEKSTNYEYIRDITLKSILNDQAREAIKKEGVKLTFAKDVSAWDRDGDEEYVFVLSDFHYDGDEDMLKVLERVYAHIRLKQQELGFTKIKLVELGDTFDGGSLRNSQLMAIKKGMVAQVIDIAKAYAKMINALREYMFVEFYCVTSSNHTQIRPLGTKQNQLVEEDLMHVFADYIELFFEDRDINFSITKGKDLDIEVAGYGMFVSHGHLVKGSAEAYLPKVAFNRDLKVVYALFGHRHHYREVTLYSGDTYNKKLFFAPSLNYKHGTYEADLELSSKAGFIMMVFNKERGHRYTEELFI